jgi:hypothetical protein
MSYDYKTQQATLFNKDGQVMFLKIRDKAHELLKSAGAVRSGKLLEVTGGDTWDMLACIDRLVELGELREITDGGVAGQHRVFVSGRTE